MRKLLIAVSLFGMAACSESPSDVDDPVSGVWQARIANFGDTLDVQLGFGFDEATPATANGGVRAFVLSNNRDVQPRLLKQGHTITRLRHRDGEVEIAGTVHLGAPLRTLEFSGTIDRNDDFEFQYKSPAGSGTAVAEYAGAYVRPATPSFARVSADLLPVSSYIGTYFISGTTGPGRFCDIQCQLLNPVSPSITMTITSMVPDGTGGYAVSANSVSQFPGLTAGPTNLHSDIWPGAYMIALGNEYQTVLYLRGSTDFNPQTTQVPTIQLTQIFQTGRNYYTGTLNLSARQ